MSDGTVSDPRNGPGGERRNPSYPAPWYVSCKPRRARRGPKAREWPHAYWGDVTRVLRAEKEVRSWAAAWVVKVAAAASSGD